MPQVTAVTVEEQLACPIRNILANVQGKWQPLILLTLEDGPARFNALKRQIGDISQRVLTENLRLLEREGYVARTVSTQAVLKVEYALTDLGLSFMEKLGPMVLWAADAYPAVRAARNAYDRAQA